jgi:hypothetical protein
MATQGSAGQEGDRSTCRDEVTEKAISRAVGGELRRAREANGWSRGFVVARLPSGIGDRTLLSYEHGTRHLTLLRFIEICRALGEVPPLLLNRALQRARIHLENLVLQVDVRQLVTQRDEEFVQMVAWAHNKLIKHPDGVVELAPSTVVELADFIGCPATDLAKYLAGFVPDHGDTACTRDEGQPTPGG